MEKLKRYVIIIFIFCALVLGNGAIPTVLAKVFLVLGALPLLLPGSYAWKTMKLYYFWCIAFCMYCIASISWAYDRGEAMAWINTICFVYICNIALAALVINQKQTINYWLKCFMYFSLLMSVVFIALNGFQYGEDLDRTSTSINMNTIGMVAAISTTIAVYLYYYNDAGKRKSQYAIIATLLFLIVLISASRKSLMIPLIAYGIFKLVGQKPSRLILNVVVLSFVGIFSVWAVLNIPILYEMMGYRIEGMINGLLDTGGEVDSSTNTRMLFVEVGLIYFAKKPIWGSGVANFGALYAANFPGRDAVYSHNNYIELLVNYGIIGTLIYYAFFIYILINLYKIIKSSYDKMAALLFSLLVSEIVIHYGFVAYYDLSFNILLTLTACYVLNYKYQRRRFK